ncbi:hypothetical protein AC622_04130 [Bacillus sp. FJAT-27916]|nr:hypothetical protein AC622_04130 [Bacillus sp. FJAT-27916]
MRYLNHRKRPFKRFQNVDKIALTLADKILFYSLWRGLLPLCVRLNELLIDFTLLVNKWKETFLTINFSRII